VVSADLVLVVVVHRGLRAHRALHLEHRELRQAPLQRPVAGRLVLVQRDVVLRVHRIRHLRSN
jgi:hypothetical protein